MLKLLKKLGCGKVMLAALTSMYTVTQFLLGTTDLVSVVEMWFVFLQMAALRNRFPLAAGDDLHAAKVRSRSALLR